MEKKIVTQVQEAQRVPYMINPRRNVLRQILIKLQKLNKRKKVLLFSFSLFDLFLLFCDFFSSNNFGFCLFLFL